MKANQSFEVEVNSSRRVPATVTKPEAGTHGFVNLVERARNGCRSLDSIRLHPFKDPEPEEGTEDPFPGDSAAQQKCAALVARVRSLVERKASQQVLDEAIHQVAFTIAKSFEFDRAGLSAYVVLSERLVDICELRPTVAVIHLLTMYALLLAQDGEDDVASNVLTILANTLRKGSVGEMAAKTIVEGLSLAHLARAQAASRAGSFYAALRDGFEGFQRALGGGAAYKHFAAERYLKLLQWHGHIDNLEQPLAALRQWIGSTTSTPQPWVFLPALWDLR